MCIRDSTTIESNDLQATAGSPPSFFPASGLPANTIADDVWVNSTTDSVEVIYKIVPVFSGCVGDTGMITVTILPAPILQVTGGDVSACADANPTVTVGLDGSQMGTTYELFYNGVSTGNTLVGTGSAISFGPQTNAGSYTIEASNPSCGLTMINGAASLTINPTPSVSTNNAVSYTHLTLPTILLV